MLALRIVEGYKGEIFVVMQTLRGDHVELSMRVFFNGDLKSSVLTRGE